MKTIGKIIILTFVVGGLIFARSGKSDPRAERKSDQVKSEHYWVKDHSKDNSGVDKAFLLHESHLRNYCTTGLMLGW